MMMDFVDSLDGNSEPAQRRGMRTKVRIQMCKARIQNLGSPGCFHGNRESRRVGARWGKRLRLKL